MSWTFERRLFGEPDGLDMQSVGLFLMHGYYFIPRTMHRNRFRAVIRTGDANRNYDLIGDSFPDALLAQKPAGRFALHFSGGFDSSILAKLYDSPDAD